MVVLLINVGAFLVVMVPLFFCHTFGWLDRGRSNIVRWPLSIVIACYLVWYATWAHGNNQLYWHVMEHQAHQEALILLGEAAGEESPVAAALRQYRHALEAGTPSAEAIAELCEQLRAIPRSSDAAEPQ